VKEKSTEGARSQGRYGRVWRHSPGRGCSGCCSSSWRRGGARLGAAPLRAAGGGGCSAGYRNGVGKPRRLSMSGGRSRCTGAGARTGEPVRESAAAAVQAADGGSRPLLPELYLHGLAHGDFDRALRGLLGEAAPLSTASIAR